MDKTHKLPTLSSDLLSLPSHLDFQKVLSFITNITSLVPRISNTRSEAAVYEVGGAGARASIYFFLAEGDQKIFQVKLDANGPVKMPQVLKSLSLIMSSIYGLTGNL